MSKSFHSRMIAALDETHTGPEGRLSTAQHYALKKAMREANMSGRQFADPEDLAQYMAKGRRFQR